MEEIDKIILHTLRQIGCDLEDEVDTLGQFSTELVVEATARCIRLVNPGAEVPLKLSPSLSARFQVGGMLAQACVDLGYKGDIGYQTFLYSTETDIRRVFMFLIEKLPKESEKVTDEPLGCVNSSVFHGCQFDAVRGECKSYKMVAGCEKAFLLLSVSAVCLSFLQQTSHKCTAKWRQQLQQNIAQEWSSLLATSKAPTPLPRKISVVKDDVVPTPAARNISSETPAATDIVPEQEKPAAVREEEKVQQLQQEVKNLSSRVENLHSTVRSLAAKAIKAGEDAEAVELERRTQEEKFAVQKKTSELLPEAEVNVGKLQALVEASTQRLVDLANQWERHRAPLVAKYRELREKNSQRESESQRQAETLRVVRERIRELAEESRAKDQMHKQLTADCEKLTKDVNRSAYTRRILEIIGNIRKQKEEIDKVLADTRQVQKEINQLTGRLDRSFAVADELIFKDAKREEAARRAYKLLATLHSDCAELVGLVQETGATMREIRDLEDQIETESAKNVSANLERITADLRQMKQESASLMAQLKSKS
ncbi:hypothetical protein B566_EDAN006157 [Ephemera danica]|nr:hypothetical protein B566_EDAN006157 [Ephemera danica]